MPVLSTHLQRRGQGAENASPLEGLDESYPLEYFHFPLLKHISCYTETGSSMRKTYQFRLYPNKNQEVKLNSTLSTCRRLYNDSLAERKRQAELNNLYRSFDVFLWGKPEWINYYDQQNALPDNKNQYQKELHSHVLQNVLRRVDIAFKNFFRGNGYPRFQRRNRYNSFTYPDSNGGYKIIDGLLWLSKIGKIKLVQHREMEGWIKTCTIKKDIDQWYVIFSVDIDKQMPAVEVKTSTGIDV